MHSLVVVCCLDSTYSHHISTRMVAEHSLVTLRFSRKLSNDKYTVRQVVSETLHPLMLEFVIHNQPHTQRPTHEVGESSKYNIE